MNGMTFALILSLTAITANAIPKPKLKPYSDRVKLFTEGQKDIPKEAVYIGQAVKAPGAYRFQSGMTILDLIKLAGGLKIDPKPTRTQFSISVFRPTKKAPDPETSIFVCYGDLQKKPEYGLKDCKQPLSTDDLVFIPLVGTQSKYILP